MSEELSAEELRDLSRHAEECEACASLLELHDGLSEVTAVQASESDLLEVRRGVLRTLRTEDLDDQSGALFLLARVISARPMLTAFSALFALGVAFVSGLAVAPSGDGFEASFTGSIERAAARNVQLAQTRQSPYVYSNVDLQAVDEQTVRLGFDVATHLDLVRAQDDPLVAEILVQSLVGSAPLNTRLDAIDMVGEMEPKVRDALVVAMLEDPDLAVRLKAISKLTTAGGDPVIQDSMLEVLRSEDSVTMRLLAIDHLTRNDISAGQLRLALLEGRPEPGTAVYSKAEEYLRIF